VSRERKPDSVLRELGKYGALGLEMAISVVIGMAIGWWLDRKLGTTPWLMVVWIGFGFAAGVRSLWRSAKKMEREMEKDDGDDGPPG
jgi:F0F1-type ATP synthase assembly protein I